MSDQANNAETIFGEAIEIQSDDDRAAFLGRACGHDPQLRAEVEQLVADHFRAGSFLREPVARYNVAATMPSANVQVGSYIGPYKLRERVGEGGMGVVWAAEQKQPLRRKVAIKVIKPGMDSSQVIARFEAEREALSLMDHSNIARVLDAGTTDAGHPYFVMELIHGVPITDYCDAQRLTIEHRIRLFVQVCKAVQHAHVKGIVHRDIKPSNVLVTEQDGEAVPKVIDFGVAKALHRPLIDRSIYTGMFQAIGTLAYMSPEQATLSQYEVDTRADVYGLGILLYELLTGTTPLDRAELEQGALDEALRMIREQDPLKPSTKISSLGDKTEFVSQLRCTDARSLGKSIRGDLDWIVMKALEKDRNRRYETVSGLRGELVRFLNNEPVEACPPSRVYRTRKFVQRNRGFVAALSAVLIALVAGIVGMSGFSMWALEERDAAKVASAKLMESYIREAVAAAFVGDDKSARELLSVIEDVALSTEDYEYDSNVIEGVIAYHQSEFGRAEQLALTALSVGSRRPADQISARALLASALWEQGESNRFGQEVATLRNLTPRTDTDHLLKALALVLFNPYESLAILKAKPKVERSAIGMLIRGIARVNDGGDKQNAMIVDQAIQDFECSRMLTERDNRSVSAQLYAIAIAIEIARAEGRDEDVERYIRDGRLLCDEPLPNNAFSPVGLWVFLRAAGENEKATRALRPVGRHSTYDVTFLAAEYLRQLDGPEALAGFDSAIAPELRHTNAVRLARAHLMSGDAQNERQISQLADALVSEGSLHDSLNVLYALCLTAEPDAVRNRARAFASRFSRAPGFKNELFGNLEILNVFAGGSESECLEKARDSRYASASAHRAFGMLRLMRGQRKEAIDEFDKAVATNAVGTYCYEMARAYKERMKKDPTWPSRPAI